jgi:hypothetical protein
LNYFSKPHSNAFSYSHSSAIQPRHNFSALSMEAAVRIDA